MAHRGKIIPPSKIDASKTDTVRLKRDMQRARATGPAKDLGPGDPKHDLAKARLDTLAAARAIKNYKSKTEWRKAMGLPPE